MRIFCQKNQIFKPDKNTKKIKMDQKKIQPFLIGQIWKNLKNIQKKINFANFIKFLYEIFQKWQPF